MSGHEWANRRKKYLNDCKCESSAIGVLPSSPSTPVVLQLAGMCRTYLQNFKRILSSVPNSTAPQISLQYNIIGCTNANNTVETDNDL